MICTVSHNRSLHLNVFSETAFKTKYLNGMLLTSLSDTAAFNDIDISIYNTIYNIAMILSLNLMGLGVYDKSLRYLGDAVLSETPPPS